MATQERTPSGPMRAIGYVRVSTHEQAEEGYGLDVQRQAIVDWCRAQGHELVAIHEDPGVRGSLPLHERPGLAAALADIRERQEDPLPVAAVVVARFDRLSRATLEALLAEREFRRLGAEVVAANGMNGDSPELRFMRQVMYGVAELDKELLVTRLRAAREAKAARGGYAGGRPPFGYEAVDGELHPHPAQARVVRHIFTRVARDRWSARRVARELSENTGKQWDHAKVLGILHREMYKQGNGTRIVDPRVFNRAHAVLAERRRG